MKFLKVLFVCACLTAGGLFSVPASASAATDAVEIRLLELINQGRSGVSKPAQVMHAGVRIAARQHSQSMSSRNKLDHSGYPNRINTATPDPAESNGAPDDGFNGWSCENVAWYKPASSLTSTSTIAQKIYNMWYNSSAHRDCMFDAKGRNFNVAGLGVYYASGKWWATFDSVYDRTAPGGSPPPPSWNRVEQSGSGVTYSGTWETVSHSSTSGGSYRRSSVPGSVAKFVFTGTGVRWIGLLSPNGGIAYVTLDGVQVASVNQYAEFSAYKRTMLERTGLSAGTHTLEIRVSEERDPNATNQRTFVDAFDYYS